MNGAFDKALLGSLSFTPSALVGMATFPVGAVFLNAWRWKLILMRVGIHESTWNCARMILIGFYYNLILPEDRAAISSASTPLPSRTENERWSRDYP